MLLRDGRTLIGYLRSIDQFGTAGFLKKKKKGTFPTLVFELVFLQVSFFSVYQPI